MNLLALLSDIIAVMAPVFLIAALGYHWARADLPYDGAFITTLMINVATPCLVFATLLRLRTAGMGRALAMSAVRLGLGSAVGMAVAWAMGLEGTMRGVVVLESAMPVAVFNYLWAVRYDTAPEEVAGMVLASTAMSFITVPFLLLIVM